MCLYGNRFQWVHGKGALQEVLGENLLLSTKTCMLSLLNSEGKSNHTLEQHVAWLLVIQLLKVWCRSTKTMLKLVHALGNIYFLMNLIIWTNCASG